MPKKSLKILKRVKDYPLQSLFNRYECFTKADRLSLLKGAVIANRALGLLPSHRKTANMLKGLVSYSTITKWWVLSSLRKTENTKKLFEARMENRKKAAVIKSDINKSLKELDALIENTDNVGEREALMLIQAQLTKKIELKQKAISNEVNNKLFRVLEIVTDKLEDDCLPTDELKKVLEILKDVSAIVGLIGKTPLIAQQFNSIDNRGSDKNDRRINAIEIEVLNEIKG